MLTFSDQNATAETIPWCAPAHRGQGSEGYQFNVPIIREGDLRISVTDVRPPSRFSLMVIDGGCADNNTGKSLSGLGIGTEWTMKVSPGKYCFTIVKAEHDDMDVWFTLGLQRP